MPAGVKLGSFYDEDQRRSQRIKAKVKPKAKAQTQVQAQVKSKVKGKSKRPKAKAKLTQAKHASQLAKRVCTLEKQQQKAKGKAKAMASATSEFKKKVRALDAQGKIIGRGCDAVQVNIETIDKKYAAEVCAIRGTMQNYVDKASVADLVKEYVERSWAERSTVVSSTAGSLLLGVGSAASPLTPTHGFDDDLKH